jgi:hypothetical protein
LGKLDVPEDIIMAYWNWLNELSNWMVNTLDSYDEIDFIR